MTNPSAMAEESRKAATLGDVLSPRLRTRRRRATGRCSSRPWRWETNSPCTFCTSGRIAFAGDFSKVLGPGAVVAGGLADALRRGAMPAASLDWMKKNFFRTELELGHCLRLPEEGPCECDLYLTCAKFVTTPEYAPRLHERQRRELELMEDARSRGWDREVQRHECVVRRIDELLAELGEPVRYWLFALTLLVVATGAEAASQPRTLSAKEIRQRLIGKVITDNAHWHYYLKPNGSIDADELTRSRKGHWHLEGNRLCIIIGGAAPDECWDVAQDGKHLPLGPIRERQQRTLASLREQDVRAGGSTDPNDP